MNCNCLSDVEKKLAEKFTEQLGVTAKVECMNRGYVIGADIGYVHLTNFKITAPSKGFTRGKEMPVHANYCPICGKSCKQVKEES